MTALSTPRGRAVPVVAPTTPPSTVGHDWRVVAPWYRWARADGAEPERAVRATRPALHKYVSSDFVRHFLADPQRSVVFDPSLDVHFPLEAIPDDERLAPDGRARILESVRRLSPTDRKLFRPAHQRFYLLAIGLHCSEPGYPMVDPAQVAEAGFVIRRHRAVVPADEQKHGLKLIQTVHAAQATAQFQVSYDSARARGRLLHPFRSPMSDRVLNMTAAGKAAARELELAQRRLRVWATDVGVETMTEGWIPADEGSFGAWVPIPAQPIELVERTYPLRALSPPPDDPTHAAHDGTVFWGAVPTNSDEITRSGTARFTAFDRYEIRAWVRPDHGDCPGPLVWSAPTEPFRLASFYDPDGCSQRPIDVQLPDFNDLQASNALPSVKMTAPPGSALKAGGGQKPSTGGADFEICFFSIPLITIIAMFVLNLFLPIVLFVFQLWWMLKLKFCIPPSFEADLGAALDVDFEAPSVDVDFDVDAAVDLGTVGDVAGALAKVFSPPVDSAAVDDLKDDPDDDSPGSLGFGPRVAEDVLLDPLVRLAMRQGYGAPDDGAPDFTRSVAYTTTVTRDMVVHP